MSREKVGERERDVSLSGEGRKDKEVKSGIGLNQERDTKERRSGECKRGNGERGRELEREGERGRERERGGRGEGERRREGRERYR